MKIQTYLCRIILNFNSVKVCCNKRCTVFHNQNWRGRLWARTQPPGDSNCNLDFWFLQWFFML